MKKIIRFFAYTCVVFFLLSLYGALVKHVSKGGDAGPLTKPVVFATEFPNLLMRVFEEKVEQRRSFKPLQKDFVPINKLEEDLIVLRSITNKDGGRDVLLQNLKNNEILRTWTLKDSFRDRFRVKNPLMMPNGDLIYNIVQHSGLKRIDQNGNYVWQADPELVAHHSLNLDHEGNVWGCVTRKAKGKIIPKVFESFGEERRLTYQDNEIIKWNAETGEVMYRKSLTDLMLENDLTNALFQQAILLGDPFHLNDVEPILQDTGFFEQGDILVSLRNSHTVFHYRPSNDSIIKVIKGPFAYQHDVDLIDGHTIAIFNNNIHKNFNSKPAVRPNHAATDGDPEFSLTHSNVLLFNYQDESFSPLMEEEFEKNKINTKTEGLYTILPNGNMLVEQQNDGILWVLSDTGVVYKNQFESQWVGFREDLNWTRVILK
jgi:hypothetical protein